MSGAAFAATAVRRRYELTESGDARFALLTGRSIVRVRPFGVFLMNDRR